MMNNPIWEVIEDKIDESWLEMKGSSGLYTKDENWNDAIVWDMKAICKRDGCFDLFQYYNGYSYNHVCEEPCGCQEDYIHICDMEGFIKFMADLKEKTADFYKKDPFSTYFVETREEYKA